MKFEKKAKDTYKTRNGYDLCDVGLIVCEKCPWLAYSADVIIMKGGEPWKLLEVKCPLHGRNSPAVIFFNKCDYLKFDGLRIVLKEKRRYYAQVQFGMYLLNLSVCDFVLYSSYDDYFLNIIVPFDPEFANSLILKVTDNYFKYMLHYLCTK